MTEVWVTIAILILTTALIRASGPVLLGGSELPPSMLRVIALLAPALLAALVAVQTLGAPAGGEYELDARVIGVGAGAIALAGGASALPVVAVAAIATALVRLIG